MKFTFLLFLTFPIFCISQTQIGSDIDGEVTSDRSGESVSLSSDGSIIAIGASDNSGNGTSSGHVRIYKNQSDIWTQIGSDIDGEASGDGSGFSVSLSFDGSIVAIGAPGNDDNGEDSGHVRVYKNQSGIWTQVGSDINGEAVGDNSGTSVSLSSDGSIIAVGALYNDGNGPDSGQVRIYENQSGTWTQIGSDIDGEAVADNSGISVSLSSDGGTVAIGAFGNAEIGIYSGQVRIYENQSGTWTQIGSDIDGESQYDFSGFSISLSSDGSIVAIGAIGNGGNGTNSGHVRVYENQLGIWTQIGSDIDGEAANDASGFSVSLSSNGSIVGIGATLNNGNGQVRIYKNQSGTWTQIGSDINGEAEGDQSGTSVSLSSDGSSVAIGAPLNDGNGTSSGHVRVYDLSALLSSEEFVVSNFNFYPNPAKTKFTIQLDNTTELKNVTVYNNLGQQLLTSKNLVVDTSKLASGLYVVEIETNKGKGSKKLIIE